MNALVWRSKQLPAEIEATLAEAIDENGEIVNEVALKKFEELAREKIIAIEDLALFVRQSEEIGIAHFDAEIARLKALKGRMEKARDIAFAAIEAVLPRGEKIESDFVKVSWRKSKTVVIDGAVELLPEEFQRTKITVDADKTKIKAAIEAGQEVPGASLVERMNLQIK